MAKADEKIREIKYSMVDTTYISTQDMNKKLQNMKCETKLKIFKK